MTKMEYIMGLGCLKMIQVFWPRLSINGRLKYYDRIINLTFRCINSENTYEHKIGMKLLSIIFPIFIKDFNDVMKL